MRLALLLLVGASISLAGCEKDRSPSFGKTTSTHPADTFYYAGGAEPESIDPGLAYDATGIDLSRNLFEGLYGYHPITLEPIAGVATHHEISADGRRYVFHLRHDAKWTDGKQVTAHDFVYGWLRVLRKENAAQYAVYLWDLVNGKEFYEGKITDADKVGVHAPDDFTLVVDLKIPVPYFVQLAQFTTLYPVRQDVVEKWGSAWTRPEHFVGNGPYTIAKWIVSYEIELRPNPHYWDFARLRLKRAVVLSTDDNHALVRMFKTGEIDWTGTQVHIPQEYLDFLRTKDDFKSFPIMSSYFFWVNTEKPGLGDKRVRRALGMTIDRQLIVDHVTKGHQPVSDHLVPSSMTGSCGYVPAKGPSYDPEGARKLLAEAGFPGGVGLPKIELIYNTSEMHKQVAEAVQEMWKKELGVHVSIANQEWKVVVNNRIQGFFELARGGWTADYPEPYTFLSLLLSDTELNESRWKNKDYDALIGKAKGAVDVKERNGWYQKAEQLMLDEMPVLPVYTYTQEVLTKPFVKGIHTNALDIHNLKDIWLEDPKAPVAPLPMPEKIAAPQIIPAEATP